MIMSTVLIDQYRLPLAILYSTHVEFRGKFKVINKYIAETTSIVHEAKTTYMVQRNTIRALSHARYRVKTARKRTYREMLRDGERPDENAGRRVRTCEDG